MLRISENPRLYPMITKLIRCWYGLTHMKVRFFLLSTHGAKGKTLKCVRSFLWGSKPGCSVGEGVFARDTN